MEDVGQLRVQLKEIQKKRFMNKHIELVYFSRVYKRIRDIDWLEAIILGAHVLKTT